MKKASAIALLSAAALLSIGFALPVLFETANTSGSYLSQISYQLGIVLKLFGGITAVWGLIGLIFNKQINSRCTLKSSCVALGISATVSLGIYCVLSFLSCYFLTHPGKHPIRHPASLVLGVICFAVFLALIHLYIKLRNWNVSASGIAFDVIFGISYLPAFGSVWVVADSIVSGFF